MGRIGGIGAKMLSKMGWTEGTGLGRNRDGVVDALVHKRRPQALGIGAEKQPFQDAWWEKMLESAYGTSAKQVNDEALFQASEGRRCRPHGTAKLARLEAHDKSNSADEESKVAKSERKLQREQRKKERKLKKKRRELKLVEMRISKKRKKSRKDNEGTEDKIR
ncbi:G-patch domain containing protein [Gracilaria domingensis]|nr:G-patch domain containing protein [Gracilaria domingensis]